MRVQRELARDVLLDNEPGLQDLLNRLPAHVANERPAVGHDLDLLHVANGHALHRDRRADTESGSILEIGFQSELTGERATAAGHEEDQDGQRDAGDQHSDTDTKLRPSQLLLARHQVLTGTWL